LKREEKGKWKAKVKLEYSKGKKGERCKVKAIISKASEREKEIRE
jgi:hypothetical protein